MNRFDWLLLLEQIIALLTEAHRKHAEAHTFEGSFSQTGKATQAPGGAQDETV